MIKKISNKINSYYCLVFNTLSVKEILDLYTCIYLYLCCLVLFSFNSDIFLLLNSYRESFMNFNFNMENKDQELITE